MMTSKISNLISRSFPYHAPLTIRNVYILLLLQAIQDKRLIGCQRSIDSRTITSTHGHWPGMDFTLQATKTASNVSGGLLINFNHALQATLLFTHDSMT